MTAYFSQMNDVSKRENQMLPNDKKFEVRQKELQISDKFINARSNI